MKEAGFRFWVAAAALGVDLAGRPDPAMALRPYGFTDADTVDRGVVELEIGLATLTCLPHGETWVDDPREAWALTVGVTFAGKGF